MSGPRVLALTGPTTSGKTALSIPVSRALDGEVISMDARQVYRGMDIGTDKVGGVERAAVPHHGLDVVDPDERYSAGRWAREAREWIAEIQGRGRLPILVGGTGFFLKALMEPLFREPSLDPDRRRRLRNWLSAKPPQELARWIQRLDPERAELAAEGGPQRLSRSLEVPLLTGRTLSWWHDHAPPEAAPVQAGIVVLSVPRELLYEQINARARRMFEEGLLEEVKGLLEAGFSPSDPGMTATGYGEAAQVVAGELSVEEAVDRVQRATRRYARRQLTWFRNQLPDRRVLRLAATLPLGERVDRVTEWWKGIGDDDGG